MSKVITFICAFSIIGIIALSGCGSEKIKAHKPTQESSTLSVADYEVQLAKIKKRITFSDGLLKAFPDLYERLATIDATDRFNLLQQITAFEKANIGSYKYRYKDAATNTDIANLINEVLRDGESSLAAYQKMAIVDVIRGKAYPSWASSERAPYGTGWHTPVPEANFWIIKFLQEKEESDVSQSPAFITDGGTRITTANDEECVKEYIIGSIPQNDKTISVLTNLLTDKCYRVRCYAVEILGKMSNKEVIPGITGCLKDKDEQVRMSAIRSLGQLNAVETIPEIRKHLKDKGWGARIAAAETLAQLGSKKSIPDIMELLQDEIENVRWFTVETLVKMGAKESIPEIRKLLQDKDRRVFLTAIQALGYFKDTESIDELIKLLQNNDAENAVIRQVVIYAIRDMGAAREWRPVIMKLLKDEYGGVRHAVVTVLKDSWVKQDVPEIIELLKDKDCEVRAMAYDSIKQWGDKEAIPGLVELMKNQDVTARGFAAIILVELGAKDQVPKEVIPDIKTILKWGDEYAQHARKALSLLEEEN